MREASFSDNEAIISDGTTAMLIGASGTTKFQDLGFDNYKKNGIDYTGTDQQAPMNEFAIVHIRNLDGWTAASGVVFGKGSSSASRANVDFAEIILASEPLSESVGIDITEYLATEWAI
jgi:hypothetical protein